MGDGHSGGGSIALADLIDRAGDGLLHDFLHYYGVNLIAGFRSGEWSPRLVLALVGMLPAGSATFALLQDRAGQAGWGSTQELLAALIDAVNANTIARGNLKKSTKFEPVPRPGGGREVKKPESTRAAYNVFAAALGG